ncbi:dynamin-related protein [Acrasis kona]|uniref:Dynamin-related protein n=1 Tax=Acrasis kona TaxID=1008807 RepID=A0AAW2Z8L4_9EUKA
MTTTPTTPVKEGTDNANNTHKIVSPKGAKENLFNHVSPLILEAIAFCRLHLSKEDQNKLNLTAIAVIGGQSDGKSTTLNRLIGYDLFPTDSNTCTLCPVNLYLRELASEGDHTFEVIVNESDERGTQATKNQDTMPTKFIQFSDAKAFILNKIKEINNRRFKEKQTILDTEFSDEEVHVFLNIKDFNSYLHVIDLPGIIDSQIGKDKQRNEAVKRIVRTFVDRPNYRYLLVHSGNTNIERASSMNLLMNKEEWRSQTIGVLTKIDQDRDYTNLKRLMNSNQEDSTDHYKLENKWYGVINISKNAEEEDKTFQEITGESSVMIMKYLGIVNVQKKVIHFLMKEIKEKFEVELWDKFNQLKISLQKELKSIPDLPSIAVTFHDISISINNGLRGSQSSIDIDLPDQPIQIRELTQKYFDDIREMDPFGSGIKDKGQKKSFAQSSLDKIAKILEHSKGYESDFHISHSELSKLLSEPIKIMSICTFKYIDDVKRILEKLILRFVQGSRYVPLAKKLFGSSACDYLKNNNLASGTENAKEILTKLFVAHQIIVFDNKRLPAAPAQTNTIQNERSREGFKKLVMMFDSIKASMIETVPRVVTKFMVEDAFNGEEIINTFNNNKDELESFYKEDEEVLYKKRRCARTLASLNNLLNFKNQMFNRKNLLVDDV